MRRLPEASLGEARRFGNWLRRQRPPGSVCARSQTDCEFLGTDVCSIARRPVSVPVVSSNDAAEPLRRLVDLYMRDFDDHIDVLVATLSDRIVEYHAVPAEEIRQFAEAIVPVVVAQLPALTVSPLEVEPLADLARLRAEQGFPPEALTRSIQIAAREVLRVVDTLGDQEGVEAAVMLRVHDLSWQFAIDAAAVIATINHEIAVEIGRRESGRRADFLRGILRGTLQPQQVKVEARDFGLDVAIPYYPVRARPSPHFDGNRISLLIERTGATSTHQPVVALIDGDVVAIVPHPPTTEATTTQDSAALLIAVGDPAELTSLAESFSAATLALETALAFERTGIVALADLGALPAILLADDLASLLEKTHFAELDGEQGSNSDVARTVWTWLRCDQNVDEVATRMHIHRNTVRYRLTRFKELTELDLHRTDDLIVAWLSLGRRVAAGTLSTDDR